MYIVDPDILVENCLDQHQFYEFYYQFKNFWHAHMIFFQHPLILQMML